MRDEKLYFKKAVNWPMISSTYYGAKLSPQNIVLGNGVRTGFIKDNKKTSVEFFVSYLSSVVANNFLKIINPTLNYNNENIETIPLNCIYDQNVHHNGCRNIFLSKIDWDSYETSWDFTTLPILHADYQQPSLKNTYRKLHNYWKEMTLEMQRLENENNRIFIEIYGLQEELEPDVPLCDITLNCNPYSRYGIKRTNEERETLLLADTMKEFISYSVGCMFGRYSLNEPGLILANQGDTIEKHFVKIPAPKFKPDDDNVIPIMDVDWFSDDIAERFKRFLKITFGEEYYIDNLEFIETAIGKDIRKFFLKDFYCYHVKMYKNRPIYWMFSSPKGSFNVLIYMHRYRPDTVSIILNDYLREFRTKLTARKDNFENISISTSVSQGEKTKALKEIEKIKKNLDELDDYERNILYPLAIKQIEIDLDDGVKINYQKFNKALKNISGLSA